MWTRVELKTRAKELLTLNYWKAVLVSLIFAFIGGSGSSSGGSSSSTDSSPGDSSAFSGLSSEELSMVLGISAAVIIFLLLIVLVSIALSYFVFMPLQVGCQRFFIQCDRNEAALDDVTYVFSNSYFNVVKIMFFRNLYTFLWTLLFIIPGIIKAYEYRMIPYILAENPSIDKKEAFALSKRMMDGNKADAWVLDLSFIGWNILGAFTCCILNIFYVEPYRNLTNAQLYLALKKNHPNDFPSTSGSHDTQNTFTQNDNVQTNYESNPYLQ